MAKLFCREADRVDPSRMRRPCHRIGRTAFAPSPKILRELLQHLENAPLIGQGCATLAPRPAGRTYRVACHGRRATSPICSNLSFRHTHASFEARSSVSTWLLAIARYKALSARRRRTDAELDDEVASKLADPADDPELALQKKNRAEVLRRSLARLSPEHGEVIDLVYYHGKSVKEVAEIIGIAEATVKTRMFYARKKLAALVATA